MLTHAPSIVSYHIIFHATFSWIDGDITMFSRTNTVEVYNRCIYYMSVWAITRNEEELQALFSVFHNLICNVPMREMKRLLKQSWLSMSRKWRTLVDGLKKLSKEGPLVYTISSSNDAHSQNKVWSYAYSPPNWTSRHRKNVHNPGSSSRNGVRHSWMEKFCWTDCKHAIYQT